MSDKIRLKRPASRSRHPSGGSRPSNLEEYKSHKQAGDGNAKAMWLSSNKEDWRKYNEKTRYHRRQQIRSLLTVPKKKKD